MNPEAETIRPRGTLPVSDDSASIADLPATVGLGGNFREPLHLFWLQLAGRAKGWRGLATCGSSEKGLRDQLVKCRAAPASGRNFIIKPNRRIVPYLGHFGRSCLVEGTDLYPDNNRPKYVGRREGTVSNPHYGRRKTKHSSSEAVAGNGLLNRRMLLGRGAILAGAIGTAPLGSLIGAAAEPPTDGPLSDPPWSLEPGATIEPYQRPSHFEKDVVRTLNNPDGLPGVQGTRAASFDERLDHPERAVFSISLSHSGAPDIDPDKHRLVIHGLVKRSHMVFTLDALARYPMTTRVTFLECGGNSGPLFSPEPLQANVQALHGLTSCAEWTGVKLRVHALEIKG